jgi:hypothetical protein
MTSTDGDQSASECPATIRDAQHAAERSEEAQQRKGADARHALLCPLTLQPHEQAEPEGDAKGLQQLSGGWDRGWKGHRMENGL